MTRRRPVMRIGQEFTHPGTGERWRVTDVGTRTFLALNLTRPFTKQHEPPAADWFTGPPYAVTEYVWDENDQRALEDVDGIEWAESPDPLATLNASLGISTDTRGEAMWPEWLRTNTVWCVDETGAKRTVTLGQLLADLAMQEIACLPANVMQRLIRERKT